ncbi:MAG TPA: hypothetical protein VGL94_09065, partial [Ktedonobacteraceae bacterium]
MDVAVTVIFIPRLAEGVTVLLVAVAFGAGLWVILGFLWLESRSKLRTVPDSNANSAIRIDKISPFAQVASPFPFFQWRKRLYGKNSPKEMTEDKIG